MSRTRDHDAWERHWHSRGDSGTFFDRLTSLVRTQILIRAFRYWEKPTRQLLRCINVAREANRPETRVKSETAKSFSPNPTERTSAQAESIRSSATRFRGAQ